MTYLYYTVTYLPKPNAAIVVAPVPSAPVPQGWQGTISAASSAATAAAAAAATAAPVSTPASASAAGGG